MSVPRRLCSRALRMLMVAPRRVSRSCGRIDRRSRARRALGEVRAERRSGVASPPARDRGRPARRDHASAAASSLGTEVDDPVGGGDDVEVVLDDEHRVSGREQRVERRDQAGHVLEVKPRGGFVEDEQGVAWGVACGAARGAARGAPGVVTGAARREVLGELQPLRLAARERRHRLAEPQVAETDCRERREGPLDVGAPGEEVESVVDGHLEDVGDGAGRAADAVGMPGGVVGWANSHVEHFVSIPAAVAVGAAQVHVAQELHLDVLEAVSGAARASTIAGVEAERPRRVSALDCDRLGGEPLADRVERADVARGIRTGGLPDR